MGYTTSFSGSFSINPPLSCEHHSELNEFADTRHAESQCPGIWCNWISANSGSDLEWNGAEKFYSYTEWLIYLVDTFFKPNGYAIAGQVEWQGEESGDSGIIYAMDNHIEAVENKLTNPGPSWSQC